MIKCIKTSGFNSWSVREIYNIINEERLEMVIARLEELEDAENYEVRAFSIKNIPILSPLIIGEEHVFLSTEDPQYYRVKQGICIQSKDCVNLVKDYFESLWNNSQMINQELRILNECLERKGVLASIRRSSLS